LGRNVTEHPFLHFVVSSHACLDALDPIALRPLRLFPQTVQPWFAPQAALLGEPISRLAVSPFAVASVEARYIVPGNISRQRAAHRRNSIAEDRI
ncbi:MAG: hypothetical protein WB949_15115, partial [Candidatus Acidiferrales bacterium]